MTLHNLILIALLFVSVERNKIEFVRKKYACLNYNCNMIIAEGKCYRESVDGKSENGIAGGVGDVQMGIVVTVIMKALERAGRKVLFIL